MHPALAVDPDYVARFERHVELARRIYSSHVVGVLGFGVREDSPDLALEYVDGSFDTP
jgi:sugar phosphate isomerase/epimerase